MFDVLQMGLHSAVVDGPLHTMALGVAQHCVGNVLHQLVFEAMPDGLGNAAEKMEIVWELVQTHYAEHHASARFCRLELSAFCDPRAPNSTYPELHSKAKECEHLTHALAWVWEQYANAANPVHVSISQVMRCLCALFNVCREPGWQLSAECKRRIMEHADVLLLHYTALGNKEAAEGRLKWNVVQKMHSLWHWSRQCQYVHPRDTGTYADEDFVGIVKEIAVACTAGIAIARLPATVMKKYVLGMMLRWHRRSCAATEQ
jgi:hypothetical protein